MNWLARQRLLIIGAICLFWAGLVLLLHSAPDLPFVSAVWSGEKKFEDFLQREGRKTPTRDDFVFLGIDQSTLQLPVFEPNELANNRALQLMTARPFPWSREVWALLLDRLFGPAHGWCSSIWSSIRLTTAIRPSAPRSTATAARSWWPRTSTPPNAMQAIVPNDVLIPPPPLADPRVGYVNFFPDLPDQRTRSIHYTMTDRQLAGLPPHPSEEVFHALSARGLDQLGRSADVPRDHDAHLIRFSADDAYLPRPLYEVFDDKLWHANYHDGAFFKDKIVIVGASAQIMHDVVDTPLGPSRPGPKLHLEAMAAAMAHQFLRMTPLWVDYLLVVAAGLLAWALIGFVRHPLTALLLLVGITVVYLATARIAYDRVGLLPHYGPGAGGFPAQRPFFVGLRIPDGTDRKAPHPPYP